MFCYGCCYKLQGSAWAVSSYSSGPPAEGIPQIRIFLKDLWQSGLIQSGAAGWGKGFVTCFLEVPLACLGSMAAAVQPKLPVELSENMLQNILLNLPPQTVELQQHAILIRSWSSRNQFFSSYTMLPSSSSPPTLFIVPRRQSEMELSFRQRPFPRIMSQLPPRCWSFACCALIILSLLFQRPDALRNRGFVKD